MMMMMLLLLLMLQQLIVLRLRCMLGMDEILGDGAEQCGRFAAR